MLWSKTPGPASRTNRRTCPRHRDAVLGDCSPGRGIDVRHRGSPEDVISYLRERRITLIYDPASGALNAGTTETAQTITLTAS